MLLRSGTLPTKTVSQWHIPPDMRHNEHAVLVREIGTYRVPSKSGTTIRACRASAASFGVVS